MTMDDKPNNTNIANATDVHGKTISVQIEHGLIKAINNEAKDTENTDTTIDAKGLTICPGFVDCYARLRDPGFEKKGNIESESRAAALNGITTIFCSPDTDPVIDEAATVELIHRKARDASYARILPLAALTRGLDGELLSEMATLKAAGCIAATNADHPFADLQVLRRCMDYARTFDIVMLVNPVDYWLGANGCAHEGATATRLGLPPIPVAAETVSLAVMIELAWQTGARIHFSRITSARGAQMIGQAKAGGLAISADTSINHLVYNDQCLATFDSQYRSVAPFRDETDRQQLLAAISDGTIDCICTDHSPHERDAKLAPFQSAEPGISGFDTFLPLLLEVHRQSGIELEKLLHRASSGAAEIFGLEQGRLEIGKPADLVLFDPEEEFELQSQTMKSMGKNSPRLGDALRGKVQKTLVAGQSLS